MNITAISDTHGYHTKLDFSLYSNSNTLVHCGDFTRSRVHATDEAEEFINWMEHQPFENKILVAGNHDRYPLDFPSRFQYMCDKRGITYLQDNDITIDNIKFYGSPWTTPFMDWNFMKSEADLKEIFAQIPLDTDVLITHSPAFGILDSLPRTGSLGSKALAGAITNLNLAAHIHGHIHAGYGQLGITSNCAVLNEAYRLVNKPLTINIPNT